VTWTEAQVQEAGDREGWGGELGEKGEESLQEAVKEKGYRNF